MKKNILAAIVGLVFTALTGNWLTTLFLSLESSQRTTVITVVASITAICITHYLTKRREIQSRQFAKKAEAYEAIFEVVFQLFIETKKLAPEQDQDELIKKLLLVKNKIMVWGSQEVVQWLDKVGDTSSPDNNLYYFERLFHEMRKDLGHNDNNLSIGDFIGSLTISEDKELIKTIIANKHKEYIAN